MGLNDNYPSFRKNCFLMNMEYFQKRDLHSKRNRMSSNLQFFFCTRQQGDQGQLSPKLKKIAGVVKSLQVLRRKKNWINMSEESSIRNNNPGISALLSDELLILMRSKRK